MKEIRGDVMQLIEGEFDALCITTNGFVKRNGECVMGRGIALTIKQRFPKVPFKLGTLINERGNHVHVIGKFKHGRLLSFPTKHHWREDSDINLIERSCYELEQFIDERGYTKVLLPRPGCGNGKLKWEHVKPVIERVLSDRVYIATF